MGGISKSKSKSDSSSRTTTNNIADSYNRTWNAVANLSNSGNTSTSINLAGADSGLAPGSVGLPSGNVLLLGGLGLASLVVVLLLTRR
jgi:hypothetical protein